MDLVKIYACFCDRTRLRILHLLSTGPLCVCHLQEVLGAHQVKVSRHLAYLRSHGLVTARRHGQWIVYALPAKAPPELAANLACLQDCAAEQPVFQRDLARLARLRVKLASDKGCGERETAKSCSAALRPSRRPARRNAPPSLLR